MGFFDKYKKNKKYNLPDIYKKLINEDEYNLIIEISQKYHTDNGLKISKINDGEIIIEVNNEEQHRYLDNLVRLLSSNDKKSWKELIYEHFDKLKDHNSAYNYLFKDFDYASQFLRVLIKPDDIDFFHDVSNNVHRIDFPKTITLLVIEFENQFRYILRNEIEEWGKTEEELFKIGIANIPAGEIEIKEYLFSDKFTVYIFFSGDYSSAFLLDLENNADYSIGTFGSLLAIPTKGTAYTHPIESNDILDLIQTLYPTIQEFYNEDPGSITTNFYWYYNNKIEIFPIEEDENGAMIKIPYNLVNLFKK